MFVHILEFFYFVVLCLWCYVCYIFANESFAIEM